MRNKLTSERYPNTALYLAKECLGFLSKHTEVDISKDLRDLSTLRNNNEPMQVDLEADGYADGELVYDYGKCPNCGWDFEYGDKDWEKPYCCHCGQKLHWFE